MDTRAQGPAQRQQLRLKLAQMARVFDTAWRIPGTRIRFGADALIGLIPGVGDLIGVATGLWLIWQARGVQAPPRLQLRMLGNLAIEGLLGIIPVLGDAFDVLWQSNQRNRKILVDWMDAQDAQERQAGAGRSPRSWLLPLLLISSLAGLVFLVLQA